MGEGVRRGIGMGDQVRGGGCGRGLGVRVAIDRGNLWK